MLDPVTLDQLRMLITVAEEGSFSAAARKLQRVQSAVSAAMSNLEAQLGVPIWDRSSKVPVLTEEGKAVVARARRVLGEMDALRAFTLELTQGLEPSVTLCVDALFPVMALADSCVAFTETFPTIDLRVDTQTMSSVSERVLSREVKLGIVSQPGIRSGLETRALAAAVRMLPVVGEQHPLASLDGPVPTSLLAQHVQIVLSERQSQGVPDRAVLSPRTWRVAELETKRAFILRGLGWGNLPEPTVAEDLGQGRLVRIRPVAWTEDQHTLHFFAIHRADEPLGRAHAWLLEKLEERCGMPQDFRSADHRFG